MSSTDESENLLDHLSERVNVNGWRVIGNPTRPPDPEAEELKALIQTVQKRQRIPGKLKIEEKDTPEAARKRQSIKVSDSEEHTDTGSGVARPGTDQQRDGRPSPHRDERSL